MADRRPHSIGDRPNPLGTYLKSWRIQERLTQEQVARNMEKSKSFICRIERGQRQGKCLRGYILYELAEAYGAPLAEVLKKANWPQLLLIDADDKAKEELKQYLKEHL